MTILRQEETECKVVYVFDGNDEIQVQVVYNGRKYKGFITEIQNEEDWETK